MLNEIIIKVTNGYIYLYPGLTVPIQQTNIPFEHCTFRTNKDIYWKVELIEYNPGIKCWKLKVVDYSVDDIKDFYHQKTSRAVERLAFEQFDWPQLERHLSSYQKSKLLDIIHNHDTNRYSYEKTKGKDVSALSSNDIPTQILENNQHQAQGNIAHFNQTEQQPAIKTFKVDFSIKLSESHFIPGYVTFSKSIKDVNGRVDFKIKNDFIRAEFENIKSWFSRRLKTKKIRVNAAITTVNGKVTEVTANSLQIAMIDTEMVDNIKYQRTVSLTRLPGDSEIDKTLFTADEIFGQIEAEDAEGNVFKQDERDVLSLFLNSHKTRNRKQLEYLSESRQSVNTKIRFTLHPNFGFLFSIEGKQNNHFVWELLNSHATYIWSIDKAASGIEIQFKRIESSINIIRDNGRVGYKRSYRQNQLDSDLAFYVVEHDDITSKNVDGFVKWKDKLNEKLT
jgi:hypothetical protein